MKVIMVMYDTLNRHMLPCYGCDWIHAPNFKRLAEHTVTFDNAYVGSMPCIPARRELHTGRYNFLHRSWGPLEPFDDSMPLMLREQNVYTHLASDHYHYWESGGANYHTQYSSWESVRGQEGDPWYGEVVDPEIPRGVLEFRMGDPKWPRWRQDWINRKYMTSEEQQPQTLTFEMGLEFIRKNHDQDQWFLQIETFDPHEPFFTQQHYKDLYPHPYEGDHFDWVPYDNVHETSEQVEHLRYEYAALLSMCDHNLGKVLDMMDEHDLWEDTMLIVCTDHGLLLGEKDWWAKNNPPFYNEIAHIPLFIWDPRTRVSGEHRHSLVQLIDIAPTILEFFQLDRTPDMQGHPLRATISDDTPVRSHALFGMFGKHINITDGRYVYMRAPEAGDPELYQYTLMPQHARSSFDLDELAAAELAPPFTFTKNCPVLKVPTTGAVADPRTLLFDLQADPSQEASIDDPGVEQTMIDHMLRLMHENDAPDEQFRRVGLSKQAEKAP
jgi:arylsulfatase A-like enzyme